VQNEKDFSLLRNKIKTLSKESMISHDSRDKPKANSGIPAILKALLSPAKHPDYLLKLRRPSNPINVHMSPLPCS
jgi:hypothetical protein